MTKAERLDYGESTMTHAMALTGVHINESGKIERWRVENSWGTSTGAAGFEVMTDEWFDTFVYQVVVEKKMLKSLGLEGLLDESVPVYEMPLWDALV